jgi:hypothetical protein
MTWVEAEMKELEQMRKALTEAVAEAKVATDLLHEVSCSGVELQDARMSYVVLQMDSDTWEAVKQFNRVKAK